MRGIYFGKQALVIFQLVISPVARWWYNETALLHISYTVGRLIMRPNQGAMSNKSKI